MSEGPLGKIEAAIEALELSDQVRLLEYLAPKIAGSVLKTQPPSKQDADTGAAWLEFQRLGEKLAATSVAGAPSITDAVSQLRR